jgi:hypothetical protein
MLSIAIRHRTTRSLSRFPEIVSYQLQASGETSSHLNLATGDDVTLKQA